MNIPYIPQTLFERGKYKIHSFKDNVLIIDNWYKNYDQIYKIITNMPLPRWKWKPGSRNFIDYYDCRPILNIHYMSSADVPEDDWLKVINSYYGEIKSKIAEYYNDKDVLIEHTAPLEFNFYKNIKKNVSNKFQHYPHCDFAYNCIVYLDKISSGGTALYKNIKQLPELLASAPDLLDVSSYEKIVIPAKPNRLVIIPDGLFHGGYINNHNDYVDNWRMNQILFLRSE
jgi:hypothetical protein